jgi:hypothetical protein
MSNTFRKEHPEYERIAAHIERARAERALVVGEAIGNGLVALTRAVQGWRLLFQPRALRKPA